MDSKVDSSDNYQIAEDLPTVSILVMNKYVILNISLMVLHVIFLGLIPLAFGLLMLLHASKHLLFTPGCTF